PAGTTGVVWHDLATRVEEPLFVFDRRCAPLGTATLPLSGGSLVIAGDGTVTMSSALDASAKPLRYARLCHRSLLRQERKLRREAEAES
ncbi:MAG TPA: hypothetical protein VFS32_08170, partial [Candidatus Limnocylindrales bacterium]|nr:hypothetical protein [Candidatus Limnocylindrales bacterium]